MTDDLREAVEKALPTWTPPHKHRCQVNPGGPIMAALGKTKMKNFRMV